MISNLDEDCWCQKSCQKKVGIPVENTKKWTIRISFCVCKYMWNCEIWNPDFWFWSFWSSYFKLCLSEISDSETTSKMAAVPHVCQKHWNFLGPQEFSKMTLGNHVAVGDLGGASPHFFKETPWANPTWCFRHGKAITIENMIFMSSYRSMYGSSHTV